MKSIYAKKPKPSTPKIVLKVEEAAQSLRMCRSTLEKNLHPNGAMIPFFRLGSRVFLPVKELREWASKQVTRQQREAGGKEGE